MLRKTLLTGFCFAALALAATSDTRVSEAAMRGDTAGVKALLAQGADVNGVQGDGMSALHWAVFKDDLDMARALIKAGANVNGITRIDQTTPLSLAAKNGDSKMAELLLYAGADAKAANRLGTTPLMIASAAGSVDTVKALLDHGADPNAKENAHGQTALMFAADMNRANVIKVLLARGANVNLATKVQPFNGPKFDLDGNMLPDKPEPKVDAAKAAEAPKADAKPAADAKATPAADTKKPAAPPAGGGGGGFSRGVSVTGGMTPLLFAARDGQMDAAKALVEGGADINLESGSEKMTPLVMAIANGHLDLAHYFISKGADVNKASADGLTPLYATVDIRWAPHNWVPMPSTEQENTGYLDLMKELIAKGADVNARLKKKLWFRTMFSDQTWVEFAGATPFWRAAVSTDVAAMKLLKEAGADPKITTDEGTTPLMVAAGLGWGANYSVTSPDTNFLDAVKYCVEVGIDINAVDNKGNTALHGAATRGDNELIKYMLSKGAKADLVNKAGDTTADMANGWREHSQVYPETVAILVAAGAKNSDNCRSAQCVVKTDAFKNRQRPAGAGAPTAVAPDGAAPKPVSPSNPSPKDK